MSSTISDVSESTADGPSRPMKQKLTATTGTENKLSPTKEEVVAKRDGLSPISYQVSLILRPLHLLRCVAVVCHYSLSLNLIH